MAHFGILSFVARRERQTENYRLNGRDENFCGENVGDCCLYEKENCCDVKVGSF